ncbi:MAG TPA: hypothetical protein VHR47_04315 [Bacillota bacterium]|nr:hypothetical protein [Bacillota bacterium]
MENEFIAIDPGSSKCGFARFSNGQAIYRGIVALEEIAKIFSSYAVSKLVIGNRTGSEKIIRKILSEGGMPNVEVWVIDENLSSAEGRRRFLMENRSGWRRLWPIGLQSPWAPYDDFVAVILGERFLENRFERWLWEEKL